MSIKKQAFTLTVLPPPPVPGEAVFMYAPQTQSWVVPENVYSISAVCVSHKKSGNPARILRGATVLLSTAMSIAGGVGGGNGGVQGGYGGYYYGGPGGAGGYYGNGGDGGVGAANYGWLGGSGTSGSGGGGGGGCGGSTDGSTAFSYGGAVGLLGTGPSGAGGVAGAGSPPGYGGVGSPPGTSDIAGAGYVMGGGSGDGGDLRYLNNIPVIPGETLTIDLGGVASVNAYGHNPGIRIMWGADGRSYPSNAGDAIVRGQAVISLVNTAWTVPDKVTSIHACAQQQDGSKAAVSLVVSGSTVLRAQNGARIGDGGGDGGASTDGGGGGGGGYAGNGGATGNNGTGGAGAGGDSSYAYWVQDPVWGGSSAPSGHWETYPGSPGGGVGIQGQGESGTRPHNINGSPDPINGYMGGGPPGVAGGALAYKNSIAVTPGQIITVNAAGGRIRIIWGPARSYPSAAGNV